MKTKLKNLFHVIIQGASTMTIAWDDERRIPLDGGGFAQDRINIAGDIRSTAMYLRKAVQSIKERSEVSLI